MLRVIFLDVDCQLQHYHAHELQGASTDEQGGVPSERTFWKRFLHQICLQYSDVVSKSGMSSSSRVQLRAKMLEEKVRCKKKKICDQLFPQELEELLVRVSKVFFVTGNRHCDKTQKTNNQVNLLQACS